jgi:hypothetical protein
MAIGKSIQFISQFIKDKEFRDELNSITSRQELLSKLDFTESEFEDAVNMHFVKCQTYEEASYIQEIKMWFAMF